MKLFLKLLCALIIMPLTVIAYLGVPFLIIYRQADLYADQFYDWMEEKSNLNE